MRSAQAIHALPLLASWSCLAARSWDRALAYPPWGDMIQPMTDTGAHAIHSALAARLKRAEGHLRHVIGMIESGEAPCLDIARQLQAVEAALTQAKRALIHDHIDHCLTHPGPADLAEMKALAKLL